MIFETVEFKKGVKLCVETTLDSFEEPLKEKYIFCYHQTDAGKHLIFGFLLKGELKKELEKVLKEYPERGETQTLQIADLLEYWSEEHVNANLVY